MFPARMFPVKLFPSRLFPKTGAEGGSTYDPKKQVPTQAQVSSPITIMAV